MFNEQHMHTLKLSVLYSSKTLLLHRALRLGKIASFEFYRNLLVVVTHGGVRVHDVHALLENRQRLIASSLKKLKNTPSSPSTASSPLIDGSKSKTQVPQGLKNDSEEDKDEEDEKGEEDDKDVSMDIPHEGGGAGVDGEGVEIHFRKLLVCIASLGGVDTENKTSDSFGRINWEGSSIAIGKMSARMGSQEDKKSRLPDVYVSRAYPPCLTQIVLGDCD